MFVLCYVEVVFTWSLTFYKSLIAFYKCLITLNDSCWAYRKYNQNYYEIFSGICLQLDYIVLCIKFNNSGCIFCRFDTYHLMQSDIYRMQLDCFIKFGHLPRDVYSGLTAAVMDKNKKLQFVQESWIGCSRICSES